MPPLAIDLRARRIVVPTAIAVFLALFVVLPSPAGAEASLPPLERIAADNPVWMSAAVSQRFTVDTDTVVLARADAYPDALAGAPLAQLRDAPILLVPQTAPLPQEIFNELDRLSPTTAIILGGTAALDDSLAQAVSDLGITVQRVGGMTRFHTAAMIADMVLEETGSDQAYVVRGNHPSPSGGWPDAVAVSALAARQGRPILLSDGASLTDPTAQLMDARGITSVDVVGGTAVVADSVVDEIISSGRTAGRLAGRTRFETSLAVAEAGLDGHADIRNLFLVTGGNFTDALVASIPAAEAGGTMLLVDGRNWEGSQTQALINEQYANVDQFVVIGSSNDVPITIDHEIVDRTTGRPTFDTTDSVRIEVGQNVADVIADNPPGTSFLIASGTHRGQTIIPRDGDTFTGEPGAILNGGQVLDLTTAGRGERAMYVIDAPMVDPGAVDDAVEMMPGHEREAYPNELYAGSQRLRHVNTPEEVTEPGTWYYNYAGGEIFTFDDPTTLPSPLEVSVTPEAVKTASGARTADVRIRNLTFTHYANRPSRGVLDLGDTEGWEVNGVTVIDNHGVGVRTGPGLNLQDSRIVRNGQMGITGTDTDFAQAQSPIWIQHNEVAFNGELGFQWAWEGGSIKFGGTTSVRLIDNWIHNHPGPGPWMDEFGFDTVFARNLVEHNGLHGLMHEISTDGQILDNLVRYNGVLASGDGGSGIWVSNSPNVEVAFNILQGNRLPINAQSSPPQRGRPEMPIENLDVHDNDIRIDYLLPGLRVTSDSTYVYTEGNNRFANNRYRTRLDEQFHFWWGEVYDIDRWQNDLGFDISGAFLDINEPARVGFPDRESFSLQQYGAS